MTIKEETKLLNNTPIHRVAAHLGYKLPNIGSASCPFPDHPDRSPSFQIFKPGTRWQCFGCNRSGGSIDLVKEMLALSFLEAKKWLAEHEGISISSAKRRSLVGPSSKRTPPKVRKTPQPQDNQLESDADSDLYESYLSISPIQESGVQYLAGRAIDREYINRFMIHQAPKNSAMIELAEVYGFDRLEKSGLLTVKSTPSDIRGVFSPGSLIFPFMEKGKIVYLQSRKIKNEADGIRWWNLRSRRKKIYNVDVLSSPSAKKIAICEGILDAISATYFDYDAIALMGVSSEIPEEMVKTMRNRRVDILLDWDDAGEKRVKSLKKRLATYGVSAARLSRPASEIKDVNEYLVSIRAPQ
ncbi:toprim domain-containing protein [Ferrimonas balearica]|nr:toprim domain-containing protein [Ferrimonas balearica]